MFYYHGKIAQGKCLSSVLLQRKDNMLAAIFALKQKKIIFIFAFKYLISILI